jgi:hypothetical protein
MGFFHGGKSDPTVDAMAKGGLQFFDTLAAQQQQTFRGAQSALDVISKAWGPILAGGAVPFGFSPGLDSLLKANIIQTGTEGISNAVAAMQLREQQQSGGAPTMPTGASEQLMAQIEATGQQGIARGLQQEKLAGYEQGMKTLTGATEAELGIARAEDATGMAREATGAGSLALEAGKERWAEKQSGGILSNITSIAKGIGDVTGAITGIGNVGSMFQNVMARTPSTSSASGSYPSTGGMAPRYGADVGGPLSTLPVNPDGTYR